MLILQQYPNTWSLGSALSKGTNHSIIVTISYMTLFSHCFGGNTAAVYHLFRCPMWTSEWGLYSIMKVETGALSSTNYVWAPVKGVTSTPAKLSFWGKWQKSDGLCLVLFDSSEVWEDYEELLSRKMRLWAHMCRV